MVMQYGRAAGSAVVPVNVPFAFDDAAILTGKPIYTARAGDLILFAAISINRAFDSTARLSLTLAGQTPGSAADLVSVVTAALDPPYGGNSAHVPGLYQAAGTDSAFDLSFQAAVGLVLTLDNGIGGDPGCTQGEGEVRLVIVHRTGAQPARPRYPILAADATAGWFKISGNHVFDLTLGEATSGQRFLVAGSTANDGPYTADAGGTVNISAVNQGTKTFTLGTLAHVSLHLPPGTVFPVGSSTGNNGFYTVDTADDLTGDVTVLEAIPNATADGHVSLPAATYLIGDAQTVVWAVSFGPLDDTGDGTLNL